MEYTSKIISKEECENFEEMIKDFYEITGTQLKETKRLVNYLSLFDDVNKNKKTISITIKNNIDKMEKMLKNTDQKEILKACIEYSFNNKQFNLAQVYKVYMNLASIANVKKITCIDDITVVLEQCYTLKNNMFSSALVKKLANDYITVVLEYILSKKDTFKTGMSDISFMYKSFEKISKNISKRNKIFISDEARFYELIKEHYFAQSYDEEKGITVKDESYDLVKLIKDFITDYNNMILNENDPINIEANNFFKYLLETSLDDLSYTNFPSYDNVNFLTIIHNVREKLLNEENLSDLVEKLAVLDSYHASYYKQMNQNKINYIDAAKEHKKVEKVS